MFQERKVAMLDFKKAIEEVKPAFGVDDSKLGNSIRGGFFHYGKPFTKVFDTCVDFLANIQHSPNAQLLTVLLEG